MATCMCKEKTRKKKSEKIQLTAVKSLHSVLKNTKTCCTEIYLYLFIYYERGDKLSYQSSSLRHQVWFGLTIKMDRPKEIILKCYRHLGRNEKYKILIQLK